MAKLTTKRPENQQEKIKNGRIVRAVIAWSVFRGAERVSFDCVQDRSRGILHFHSPRTKSPLIRAIRDSPLLQTINSVNPCESVSNQNSSCLGVFVAKIPANPRYPRFLLVTSRTVSIRVWSIFVRIRANLWLIICENLHNLWNLSWAKSNGYVVLPLI